MDEVRRLMFIRVGIWGAFVAGLGFLFGGLIGVAIGAGLGIGIPALFILAGGGLAKTVYNPGGKTATAKKEYSFAESLQARGRYEDAVAAFELAILEEDASDPTPYLSIARIYRDHLSGYDEAVRWFKRALAESKMPPALTTLATRELVELYATKMNAPEKAAPMLARLAHELEGTQEGEWAAGELAEIKRLMAERERDA